MNQLLKELGQNLIEGNREEVERLTIKALENKISPEEILNEGMLPAMDIVGKKFRDYEFFLPEVLVAARAMKGGMAIIQPLLSQSGIEPVGKVMLGTVRGDLHDIGKNLVGMMLQGAGFEVVDLGIDVTPEKFVEMSRKHSVQLIGLSALLTTTMGAMQDTIQAFIDNNYRENVKIIVGGAPVTDEYARKIGADGYALDAPAAVELAKTLIEN
ncbi:MAG: corrinoid protein [Calditrichaeota bacterium]|nr:corrinoid protein [Calditrichota bacterium]